MMRLDLMARFFAETTEDWRSPIADEIAAHWFDADNQNGQVKVWRASANFVCVVTAGSEKYFLRFNHTTERDPARIIAELAWVEHLAQAGCLVAEPVASRSGNLVESVVTRLGLCHAVMFHALPGSHREFDALAWTDFIAWGCALGEIHARSRGFNTPALPMWTDYLALAQHIIPESEILARAELAAVTRRLYQLPANSANFGPIHYDFELDNLTWHNGHIGVLDFDDCTQHWFAADIAYALRDLFEDNMAQVDLSHPALQAFVRGYRTAQPIADEELERLPLFLRLHNVIQFARITRSLEAGLPAEEPEWMPNLRAHLLGLLAKLRAGFASTPYLNE